MTRLTAFFLRAGLAAAIGLGVAASTSAQPARGLDARLDRIASEAELTADQTAAVEALSARFADADRADRWAAAAELSTILSDAQIDALRTAAEAGREGRARPDGAQRGRRGRGGRAGRGGDRAGRSDRGDRPDRGDRAELTDAQRDALREVRADVRTQTEALVAQLRAGDLSDAEFAARVRAVREAGQARAAAALPAEAAARMAERDAARDAEQAARAEALGLTADQQAALEARMAQRVRQAPERPDLRPYLDADGRLDREALRDAQRARREASRETRSEARDEAEQILTDDQQDIVFLHRALSGGSRGQRGGRRGGRGGRR